MPESEARRALRESLKAEARRVGFDVCGVARVPADLRLDFFRQWLDAGQAGTMTWLDGAGFARRSDPQSVLPGCQSVVVVGQNYLRPPLPRRGAIARYAAGGDYHNLMYRRLKKICRWLRTQGADNRPYVDSGPVLEKPWGVAAGLGWTGKNTLVLHPEHGQWLLLGVILTTLDLEPDAPVRERCGSCTRCLDVCPTRAFTAPYQLDARRCISYLTIEHDGPIPEALRPLIGDRLFGCDLCLEVCPWNRFAQQAREALFEPRERPDPREILTMDEAAFRATFAGSPLQRPGLARWKRNAAVVLGNIGTPEDLPALERAAREPDSLVAEHARWALAQVLGRSGPCAP